MDCCRFEEQMTRIIPSFAGFTEFTASIPKLYYGVKSQEQRILALCKLLNKVICYADMLGENVDEIAKTLQDIEDGKLDDFIVAAIDEWFEEHQEEIFGRVTELEERMDAVEDIIGDGFSSINNITDVIGSGFSSINSVADVIGSGFSSSNSVGDVVNNIQTQVDALPTFEATALFNVMKYGADNTGETDSYAAIIAAATAADGIGSLYFPDGIYSISQPLDLTVFDIHSIYGNGCVLQPYNSVVIDYLIWPFVDTVQEHKSHFHEISGVNFNGLGTVNVGLRTSQQIVVKDCNFTNFLTHCISNYDNLNDGQGLRIYDCLFINDIISTSIYNNACGIKCSYDNIVENCRFFGYKRSIEILAGHNQFNNLYIWSRAATFETVGVYCPGVTQDCEYVNCYFDSINICAYNAGSSFTNCIFLGGGGDSNAHDCYILWWQLSTGAIVGVFTSCRFTWANTISNTFMKVCNNERLSLLTVGCLWSDYFPKANVLCNLYKSLVVDDTVRRTTTADMPLADTWYKFAHANKQSNLGDGVQWYTGMLVGFSPNGRNISIQKVSTRATMEYAEQFPNYSMRSLGDIGVIQTGSTMDFYFKPLNVMGTTEFYISDVWGGNHLNALWCEFEQTTLQDSDMTTIIEHV